LLAKPFVVAMRILIAITCIIVTTKTTHLQLMISRNLCKLEIRKYSYSLIVAAIVAGPMFWNRLPPEIRANDSLQSFKSQLKTYYF